MAQSTIAATVAGRLQRVRVSLSIGVQEFGEDIDRWYWGAVMPSVSAHKRPVSRGLRANYGVELVLDLHGCDPSLFNRRGLRKFYRELCDLIGMQLCKIHF